jgi:hypothetical protein
MWPGLLCHLPGFQLLGIIGVQKLRETDLSGWTIRVTQAAPFCLCGCQKRIKVLPQHHAPSKGFPRYIPGHHPNPLRKLYAAVRAEGLLLTGDICRRLRISQSQYCRLEKHGVFPSSKRWGRAPRPRMRVFTPELVGVLRTALRKRQGRVAVDAHAKAPWGARAARDHPRQHQPGSSTG